MKLSLAEVVLVDGAVGDGDELKTDYHYFEGNAEYIIYPYYEKNEISTELEQE